MLKTSCFAIVFDPQPFLNNTALYCQLDIAGSRGDFYCDIVLKSFFSLFRHLIVYTVDLT